MTQSYIQAVAEVARLAGDCALGFFGRDVVVEAKQDGSPVTVADKTAEQFARSWIEERFPADGIVGEEFGSARSNAERHWIIDPIDGTKSFVRGVPLWGTLVAVADAEHILAGAACFPAVREIIVAAPGEGCWWNDKKASVSPVDDLSKATVLGTELRLPEHDVRGRGWRELTTRALINRTWGDCYGYLLVATGRAEVMVDAVVSQWDTAALFPIVTEAGGVFTDWSGRNTPYGGSAIATNSALAAEVRQILGATSGEGRT
jgi:histidinol phosphatase-like enzyme (inositol monophosphatase family)